MTSYHTILLYWLRGSVFKRQKLYYQAHSMPSIGMGMLQSEVVPVWHRTWGSGGGVGQTKAYFPFPFAGELVPLAEGAGGLGDAAAWVGGGGEPRPGPRRRWPSWNSPEQGEQRPRHWRRWRRPWHWRRRRLHCRRRCRCGCLSS